MLNILIIMKMLVLHAMIGISFLTNGSLSIGLGYVRYTQLRDSPVHTTSSIKKLAEETPK